MKPAPLRYARPSSVSEVVGLLAEHGSAASLLAGGQSLMPLLVRRLRRPALLIDINRLPELGRIELLPDVIRMGALVRQEQALRSAIVREHAPGVAAALAWVANPVVRQQGTVIGNLVVNGAGAELPAVALALGARFVLRDAEREVQVSAQTLLGGGPGPAPGAMVTHVLWPRRPAAVGFHEVARRQGHAPVVSAMVALGGGECRVAVSGVCATGLSCPTIAGVIGGLFPRLPQPAALAEALRADMTGPAHADAYSSAEYRLHVAPVVVQRAARLMALEAGAA